jgi:hypothetical protein
MAWYNPVTWFSDDPYGTKAAKKSQTKMFDTNNQAIADFNAGLGQAVDAYGQGTSGILANLNQPTFLQGFTGVTADNPQGNYPQTAFDPSVDLAADPGYQNRLNEGIATMDARQAVAGNFRSGRAADQLNRAVQDYAANEYNNAFNRNLNSYQANLANQGQWLGAMDNMDQNRVAAGQLGLQSQGNILNAAATGLGTGLDSALTNNSNYYSALANIATEGSDWNNFNRTLGAVGGAYSAFNGGAIKAAGTGG